MPQDPDSGPINLDGSDLNPLNDSDEWTRPDTERRLTVDKSLDDFFANNSDMLAALLGVLEISVPIDQVLVRTKAIIGSVKNPEVKEAIVKRIIDSTDDLRQFLAGIYDKDDPGVYESLISNLGLELASAQGFVKSLSTLFNYFKKFKAIPNTEAAYRKELGRISSGEKLSQSSSATMRNAFVRFRRKIQSTSKQNEDAERLSNVDLDQLIADNAAALQIAFNFALDPSQTHYKEEDFKTRFITLLKKCSSVSARDSLFSVLDSKPAEFAAFVVGLCTPSISTTFESLIVLARSDDYKRDKPIQKMLSMAASLDELRTSAVEAYYELYSKMGSDMRLDALETEIKVLRTIHLEANT